ncbi:hypothetical protein D6745_04640 [Candidatus Woesearchaeota archaeon]|nr:MAG: hypothetical protein D6745_04640 [Candidatus Woesearchaeota archaeon]
MSRAREIFERYFKPFAFYEMGSQGMEERTGLEGIVNGTVMDKEGNPLNYDTGDLTTTHRIKDWYQGFWNSRVGKEIAKRLKKEPGSVDAYAFFDFCENGLTCKNALAAIIRTNHPKYRTILAVNKRFAHLLNKEEIADYVAAHEGVHESGVSDEQETERTLKESAIAALREMYGSAKSKISRGYDALARKLAVIGSQAAQREFAYETGMLK